jgi:uncharacterized glyoxalase superfamily protein PhnB
MRSVTSLYAYLSYADVPAAIEWLEALGFEVASRQDGQDGSVQHAEVKRDDAVVMLATSDAPYETPPLRGQSTGRGVYLRVDDVDALHAAAIDAGGQEVIAPEDTEWGSRRSRVLDPEGCEWSFGTYEPGGSW